MRFGCPHPLSASVGLIWIRLSVLNAPSVYVCRMALWFALFEPIPHGEPRLMP